MIFVCVCIAEKSELELPESGKTEEILEILSDLIGILMLMYF